MSVFQFKHFSIVQDNSAMKVGTDAMLLGAFIETEGRKSGLDIGTGTGVLSLMLAQNNEVILMDAVEIDPSSANEAKLNFENSKWSNRLRIYNSDFLSFESQKQYDLIVSNPPYFSTTNENMDIRKSQARHTSSLEIAPFIKKVSVMLTLNGDFWIIIPYIDFGLWLEQIKANGLMISKRIDIVGKAGNAPIRCVLKMSLSFVDCQEFFFCIRQSDNSYSNEYIELTNEFHGTKL